MPNFLISAVRTENIPHIINTFKVYLKEMGLNVKQDNSKSSDSSYLYVSDKDMSNKKDQVGIRVSNHVEVTKYQKNRTSKKSDYKAYNDLRLEDDWINVLRAVATLFKKPLPKDLKVVPLGNVDPETVKSKKYTPEEQVDIYKNTFRMMISEDRYFKEDLKNIRNWSEKERENNRRIINKHEMIINKIIPENMRFEANPLETKNGKFKNKYVERAYENMVNQHILSEVLNLC